ncbi:PREDICTED: glutamyl aminopeptidase-like, partial [Wasmannia auropunctata]|uniref:glutamyl aminopeptidase-like n=1 Tax=Wasmannia auropunctata TaxID=64793 RepID=UPI0005F08502
IVIYFENILSPGSYILNMTFFGNIYSNVSSYVSGFSRIRLNESGHESWFIWTNNWPTTTRRIFPCWDEPKFKANFTISIRHDRNYRGFSNMRAIEKPVQKSRYSTTNFYMTPEISTCLVSIGLCKMPTYRKGNIIWRNNVWNDREFYAEATNLTKSVMKYFKTYWKQEDRTIQQIVIPGLLDNNIMKWAVTFYREANIIYSNTSNSAAFIQQSKYSIILSISRQLGTIVSPLWWNDLWLNNGIATFFCINDIVKETIDPRMSNLLIVQTV